ncbi:MAG: tetratricopeptide repeat protein [Haliscomenobacter sp.]|uniref:tetratricopeptide repeat protein n=1 Tax=Haliscomenobacter sp. TaxID=2717303 RepID=UPI0029AB5454|nr:tetratricopeptide repeat protein [Haliscomenobacter sp.]MDX2070904.1 tetratricopeptide repeat protein [Haliscomenobacter sp.]
MPQLPVILTTFANSYDEAYLSHLEKEHDSLLGILAPLSYLRHIPLSSAKTGQLVSTLIQYQQELLILHFGGHADGSQLHFKDAGGQVAGLAENLSLHPQLKLVFLNGCNTQAQAVQYLEAGVPAVIATTCSVADGQAMQFAEVFYTALAKGHTLEEAFIRAKGAMKLVDGGTYEDEILNWRGLRLRQEPVKEVPWRLYVAEDEVLEWKLSNEKRSTHFLTLDHHRQDSPVIGRTAELQHLETLTQQAGTKPIVICGASGIGKTLLAELYWEKHKLNFDAAGWLNYRTSLIHTILAEITPQNAGYIDLDQAPEKKLEWTARQYILHELQNRPGKKLLVLNNVPVDSDVEERLEWLNITDLLLIITGNSSWEQAQVYALPSLSEAEIVELFKALTGQNANEATQQLLAQLGQNALLTRLIAQNIPHDNLEKAKATIAVLQKALSEDSNATMPEQRLLGELLQLSISDPAQQWVLLQFAAMPTAGFDLDSFAELCLPEDEDIPQSTGYQHYLEDNDLVDRKTGLEDAVETLVQGAWLEQRDDELWLPDAVREVVMQLYPKHSRYFKGLIESIRLSYFGEEYGPVKGNALFVSHLQSILPWLEYGEAYLTLHQLLIKNYNDLVYWYEEEKELKTLLDVVEKKEGQWSEQFWWVCYDLSACCRRTGNIRAADHFSQVQLEVAEKIYASHSNLAAAQTERGLVLKDLGDYDRAAQLLQSALDSYLRNFGQDHPNVAVSQSNLANVLQDLGEYPHAAQLLQSALDSSLSNFGQDHPNVAMNQSNLALVLQDLGEYPHAAQLLQSALDSNLRNFGQDHPNVAMNQSNLASVLKDLGEYTRAAQLLQSTLDSAMHNFGQDHPTVAIRQSNLASVLQDLGEYPRAAQLLESALDSAMRNFGQDHPNVAMSQWNLASVYYQLDRLDEAKILLEQALKTVEKSLGVNHPRYKGIVNWLDDVNEKLNPSS